MVRVRRRGAHSSLSFFFLTDTATTEIYTLSLHDALPISFVAWGSPASPSLEFRATPGAEETVVRSEEHTSELQSPYELVCRLLLEKNKNSFALRDRV